MSDGPDFGWTGDVETQDEDYDEEEIEVIEEDVEDELEESGEAGSSQESDTESEVAESDMSTVESDSDSEQEASPSEEDESPQKARDALSEAADPFAELAGDALGPSEAAEGAHRRRVIVWGREGTGKTHFAYTAPEPIAFIDTENKAHDIAHKFEEKVVKIWQPDDYYEALDALDQAQEWLGAWLEERDTRGTLVVDSMSIIWEWSKQAYVNDYYPTKEPGDVDFKSGLQTGGQGDWKKIKEYHNERFRKPIVQSPFHLVWTAMSTEDYKEKIEQDFSATPEKPAGEKENVYKANYIVRVTQPEHGPPVGTLEKSGLTAHTFIGLERPTWPGVFEVVKAIEEAELAEKPVPPGEIEEEYEVTVLDGKPSRLRGVDDDE